MSVSPITIIFIGSCITVLGGIVTAFGIKLHNEKSSEKSSAILSGVNLNSTELQAARSESENLKKEIGFVKEQNAHHLLKIEELRKENIQLNLELHKETKEIKNSVTGGNSYLKLTLLYFSNNGGYHKILIQNIGSYPLSDATIWIMDMNNLDKLSNQQFYEFTIDSKNRIAELGQFSAGGMKELDPTFKLDKNRGVHLTIHFNANNGPSIQILRMKFVNGKWVTANKFLNRGDAPIYDISDDYPKQKDRDAIFSTGG